ncbi:alkylation response protein AidB-like acyl-CoA dehydrogenase [Nocardioides zeae]|uniref:Alkylation response protein AidB-like acyl-CoA dehydrogenase n=1 Tax=Nocardioides zeae TaxID=1457234 RepID=A0ACC6IFE2_9ACTN|nr:acyl-CoA dehydrogenase family protein [Nocardioides zeae]MDR6176413.1 alkylation response protein AidB-like acyl-CoA dehydrogenase [Nocardioides zeae]MDR6209426.1 alkylation response protein AidB-like acyl-CoA dehydrogenase [Nocardioides zeae]
MNLDEDDLAAMLAAVRKFAEAELAPHAQERDEKKIFPVDVLQRAGELGLGGLYVGEEHGGIGLPRRAAAAVFVELARGDTAIAAYISIHNMVAWMVDTFATDEVRAAWLPELSAMQKLASYCLTEPDAGSDAAAIRTTARRDGDEYVLRGVKQFISGAGSTDAYLVMARTGGPDARGISAFLVPADSEGLSFGANERKMGWNAQPTRQVVLEDVRVPASHRLGEEGEGFSIAMRGLNGGRINIAACSLGGASWAVERAAVHLRERIAFGKPLSAQQALQFRLADMTTSIEASRCLLERAATALDEGSPDAVQLCAMAKQFVTDQCFEAANAALQLHGGYGYLAEYGVERVVRDLRVHQILEGTNEIMRLIVSRAALEGAA